MTACVFLNDKSFTPFCSSQNRQQVPHENIWISNNWTFVVVFCESVLATLALIIKKTNDSIIMSINNRPWVMSMSFKISQSWPNTTALKTIREDLEKIIDGCLLQLSSDHNAYCLIVFYLIDHWKRFLIGIFICEAKRREAYWVGVRYIS